LPCWEGSAPLTSADLLLMNYNMDTQLLPVETVAREQGEEGAAEFSIEGYARPRRPRKREGTRRVRGRWLGRGNRRKSRRWRRLV